MSGETSNAFVQLAKLDLDLMMPLDASLMELADPRFQPYLQLAGIEYNNVTSSVPLQPTDAKYMHNTKYPAAHPYVRGTRYVSMVSLQSSF